MYTSFYFNFCQPFNNNYNHIHIVYDYCEWLKELLDLFVTDNTVFRLIIA